VVRAGARARDLSFSWRDGERRIRFGRGVAAEAVELLGGPGYRLLTTERAAAALPAVAAAAASVDFVPAGIVAGLAADALAGGAGDGRVVALGGGRVVDTAKAVAAALSGRRAVDTAATAADGVRTVDATMATAPTGGVRAGAANTATAPTGGVRAMAIPTTLSGAEMTRGHRHAEGVDESTPRVRAAVVVYDPALAASQPVPELAASALNALGHAVEGPCTPSANPVATLAARDAARRLVGAFAHTEPDRDELALGALLAGYTIDSTGFGLHHVMAQTLVFAGLASHGQANAILLPHTIAALAWRFPDQHDELAETLGEDPADAAARICTLSGTTTLGELGVGPADLDAAADAAARRPQLDGTPPRADRAELRALYEAAL
jgi:alcohol dehydrogenase class IV